MAYNPTFHILRRDPDGKTWLISTRETKKEHDRALRENRKGYPNYKFAPLIGLTYKEALARVKQINKKNGL